MIDQRRLTLVLHFMVFIGAGSANSFAETLQWGKLPSLPDEFGLGGPIVGTHNGALIVAGGANFPNGPPWAVGDSPPGSKVWHDRIFVLETGAENWIEAGKLPKPLAYAPAISTDDGAYVLGGETFDNSSRPSAEVLLLKWNAQQQRISVVKDALPPLPKPCHYHSAAAIGDVIYVVASHAKTPSSQMLDEKSFWSLNLASPKEERQWNSNVPWPGPAREKMSVAVQRSSPQDAQTSSKCLYMFSGATWFKDVDGNADLTRFKHFTDAYRYDPATTKWKRIADLPAVRESRAVNVNGYAFSSKRQVWRKLRRGDAQPEIDINRIFADVPRAAGAATAIAKDRDQILLFSGATGRFITLELSLRPLFPRDVLRYRTDTNQWTLAGQMPSGVVTTGAVRWNNLIVIPSGEIRPGVRTNQVQTCMTTVAD